MIRPIVIFCLFFASTVALSSAAVAQETYRCKVNGATVIQDRPCPGAIRRSDSMPVVTPGKPAAAAAAVPQVSDEVAERRAKLERDKEFIAQRVKARNDELERDQSNERIQRCESEAAEMTQKITQIADSSPKGTPIDAENARLLMIDQQNRQMKISALQSQAQAKRAECDQLRSAHNQRWKR